MIKYAVEIKSKKELRRSFQNDYFNHREWNTIFHTIIEKHNNTTNLEDKKFLGHLVNKISYRSLLDCYERNKISDRIYKKQYTSR